MDNMKPNACRRVVIADDSSTARMFMRKCLEIAGLRDAVFVETANGLEALVAAMEESCDLVVTDLTMPKMDGRELLRRLRADPAMARIPVIVITSAGNPATIEALLDGGASAVVGKPVSPARLAAICASLWPAEERRQP